MQYVKWLRFNNKLSYRRRTALRDILVNSWYISRAMGVIKVSNSKSDLQGHLRALAQWHWCHSMGHIRFPISLTLQLFLADVNSRSRSLYAIADPSVVCLSVCRLWRWCTLLRRLNFSAIYFHRTIAQGLYFSGAKNRWWGRPFPLKFAFKVTHPLFKQRNFDQYRLIAPQPW